MSNNEPSGAASAAASSEAAIEQDIQAKGLTAPRLTPEAIDAAVLTATYHVFPGTVLTVCCLTLLNGFNVVGQSAPASPENFDEALGRKIAFEDARRQIWRLEGYALKTRLFENNLKARLGAQGE